MKTSKASAALWNNANKRTNAQNGMGDPGDAKHEILTVKQLIRQIGVNPNAIELLAERAHELTPEQRRAALQAFAPPKEPKARTVAKAGPKATPPAVRRFANIPLRGFNRGAGQ